LEKDKSVLLLFVAAELECKPDIGVGEHDHEPVS
jgi:hypothetical protein